MQSCVRASARELSTLIASCAPFSWSGANCKGCKNGGENQALGLAPQA